MRTRRLDALDGLRGLTALGIVVLHVWMFDYGDAHRPDKGLVDLFVGELRLGVPVFFALSGFFVHRAFVAASLEGRPRPDLGRYAIRRAARILPAYWLALAVSFVAMRLVDHPLAVDAAQLPAFLLFAQNMDPETARQLDPPMWTLGVEVAFYVLLPLVALGTMRLRRTGQALVCGAIITTGAAVVALHALVGFDPRIVDALPYHLTAFGSGMLVVTLTHGRSASRVTGRALLAAGAALVLLDGVWHALGLGPQLLREVVADVPASAGIALVLASYALSERRSRLLGSFPVRWAGTLSYGTYLLHYPVIILLRTQDHWPERFGAALALVMTLTIAAALVCWHLVESPALRWVARRTSRGTHPSRVAPPRANGPQPARATS
jgi:peptidoglycan/LPS O-acetylase OafA/YrhL